MKGAVLVFAILATECYCDHKKECDFADHCGENEFCFEDYDHDYYWDGYCETCPSNLNECDSLPHVTSWSSQECWKICSGSESSDDEEVNEPDNGDVTVLVITLPIAGMFQSKCCVFSSVLAH